MRSNYPDCQHSFILSYILDSVCSGINLEQMTVVILPLRPLCMRRLYPSRVSSLCQNQSLRCGRHPVRD